jgi:hypothetical protein
MTINNTGNVGIGTSTPTSNLTISESNAISSTGYAASQLLTINQQDNTANRVAALSFTFGSDDRGPAIYAQNTSATGGVGDLLFAPSYNTESVRMLSSGGITFNGDTAAANALDDYEEGTWTPAYTFDAGTFSGGYAAQLGHYTKVGRIVTASFYFNTSSVNLSGIDLGTALKIGGLPFSSASSSGMTATTSSFRSQHWNSNANSPIGGYQDANTSAIRLFRYNGSTGYNTDYKSVSGDLRTSNDSNQIMGTITYQT